MKRRKFLVFTISSLLIVILLIGGIIAYLVDKDSVTNVFTVGDNIDIEVTEVWDPEDGENLHPGAVVEKSPSIRNKSLTTSAYVFEEIIVPCYASSGSTVNTPLYTYTVNPGWELIETSEIDTESKTITYVYSYSTSGTMTELLADTTTTTPVFSEVTVEPTLTKEQKESVSATPDIIINGYGIQIEDLGTDVPLEIFKIIKPDLDDVVITGVPTELQNIEVDKTATFTVTASVPGTWTITAGDENVEITEGASVVDSTTAEVTYKGLTASDTATTFTVKFVPTDGTHYKTPTPSTFEVKVKEGLDLKEGTLVVYTDANGKKVDCKVLYGTDSEQGYGIQIIPVDIIKDVNDQEVLIELGNGSGSSDYVQDNDSYLVAKESYNTAIAKLNTEAQKYLNTSLSPAGGARCVGSSPSETPIVNEEDDGNFSSPYSIFNGYNGIFKSSSPKNTPATNEDYLQMSKTNINCAGISKNYWLASRNAKSTNGEMELSVGYVNSSNTFYYTAWQVQLFYTGSAMRERSKSRTHGLRPVFTIKPDVNLVEEDGKIVLAP